MKRYLLGAALAALTGALCPSPAHATNPSLFPLQQIYSLDGSIIYGGAAGSLTTSEGVWTFGTLSTDGTDYNALINGTASGAAVSLQITNTLTYAYNQVSGDWYERESGTWVNIGTTAPVESGSGFTCGPASGTDAATDASAAGFSTCALGNDFTASTGANWTPSFSGSVATLSNWLDCNFDTSTAYPWYFGMYQFSSEQVPCSGHVAIANDPTTGSPTLRMTTVNADVTNYPAVSGAQMSTVNFGNTQSPPGNGQYPYGYYEWTFRNDNTSSSVNNAFWSFITGAADTLAGETAGYAVELDFLETGTAVVGHVTDSGGNRWGPGGTKIQTFYTVTNAATDLSNYHTWGVLWTGDGGTPGNFSMCTYVDGTRQACLHRPYDDNYEHLARRFMYLWNEAGSSGFGTSNQYVKSVKVETCSSWTSSAAAGMCPGSTLNSTGFYVP